jgi:hypothetical protein
MKLIGENRSTREKTCPSVTLSTINSTWTDLGSNTDLHVEKSAINRLSHGTVVSAALVYDVGWKITWLLGLRFETLTAVTVTITTFWDVTPCSMVER